MLTIKIWNGFEIKILTTNNYKKKLEIQTPKTYQFTTSQKHSSYLVQIPNSKYPKLKTYKSKTQNPNYKFQKSKIKKLENPNIQNPKSKYLINPKYPTPIPSKISF